MLKRPGAALADCVEALKLNPDSAKALKYRGICYAYLGQWVEAKADLAAAQSIDFNEDLEPSRRVAVERAAALEIAERERRHEEEAALREKQLQEAARRKKERVLSDFSNQILTKKGNLPAATALGPARLIAVYFSAHWCPPCRQFTPMLAEMYDTIREEEKDLVPSLGRNEHALEVVFVSSDRDLKSFEEYYGSQPWMAIPFSEGRTNQELSSKFSVSGIPALFILSGEDGSVVDSDGRSTVMNARGDAKKLLKAWKLV
jgi:thiol-disulfide isomerase/thioredoxin